MEASKSDHQDPNKKPPYSYVALIAMAIKDSTEGRLQVCYKYILSVCENHKKPYQI